MRRELDAIVQRTRADELIIAGAIHDHAARLRSYEIVASLAAAVSRPLRAMTHLRAALCRFAAWLVVAWLWVAGETGLAQTPAAAPGASAPERSSAPDARHRLQGAALVRALRDGGLIIYFRHTATDFSKNDQRCAASTTARTNGR